MPTYKFSENHDTGALILKSKKYTVSVLQTKGHIHVTVSGPRFKRRGLTSIHCRVTEFELKVIALYFAKKARDFGKHMPKIPFVNYADIFGSIFD